jgi:hypothetical protein
MLRRTVGPRWHDAVAYTLYIHDNVLFLEASLEVTSAHIVSTDNSCRAAGLVYLKRADKQRRL